MAIYTEGQRKLAEKFTPNAVIANWKDWKWQIRHSIRTLSDFERLLDVRFSAEERSELEQTVAKFPLSITPYYLSLIDVDNLRHDPVFLQAFPSPQELNLAEADLVDPLAEDEDSPVELVTHRYPDRVLLRVSNVCAMYCRHCTRKRKVGDVDSIPGEAQIAAGIDYIRRHPEVRDVLLSGGDPFLLADSVLDRILTELRSIPHVEVIRIGTRVPVVLPYRVTDELVAMLKKHHPVWINTHFNHPREITDSAREALRRLADAGIPHFPGGPHIHSLRHGFAVANLRRWAADGADLVVMLPYLSAYMGHADLRGTQYYLQLTADAYPELAAMAQARFGYVIPDPAAREGAQQ